MTPIFLHIEVQQHDAAPWLIRDETEFKAPANYKDPAKIREHIQKKIDEQEAELRSRSNQTPDGPLLGGTIRAVAVAVGDGPARAILAPTLDEAGEAVLLAAVERGLIGTDQVPGKDPAAFVLVTFDGDRFVLPFLLKRGMRHGLFGLTRWVRTAGHVDARKVWEFGDRKARGKLHELAQFVGVEMNSRAADGTVGRLWDAPEPGERAGANVALLRQVYWRFRAAGLVPETDEPIPELAPRAVGPTAPPATNELTQEEEPQPDPLVQPSGVQMPGLPVLEEHAAIYNRALASGWDDAPFRTEAGPLEARWLSAALFHLGTPLRVEFERWTGETAPGFRCTVAWHEEMRAKVQAAQQACATDELAWVAPTPVPAEATTWVMTADGLVTLGKRVAGPDEDRAAVQGRVLRPWERRQDAGAGEAA